MASSITKISRLSRNKATGNVIIFILLVIGVTSFFFAIETASSSPGTYSLLFGFLLSIFFSYIVDRKFRQPFFSETSRYLEELINRCYDVQEAAIQIELIEPLQKITFIKGVLEQIDDLSFNLEEILKVTSYEISMNTLSIRNHNVKKELREIKKLVEETLEETRRKRENIEFLANIRQIMLNSIDNQLARPLNEIEYDYLVYKVQKHMQHHFTDDYLLKQVFEHILTQGEIIGKLNQNNSGDLILTVERSYEGELIGNISWDKGKHDEKNCVICRYPIKSHENSVECPSCKNIFHRNHLLEWLKVFNQCPMCHQRLTLFSNSS